MLLYTIAASILGLLFFILVFSALVKSGKAETLSPFGLVLLLVIGGPVIWAFTLVCTVQFIRKRNTSNTHD